MKKIASLFLLFSLPILGLCVDFNTQSWSHISSKAEQENKLLFVEIISTSNDDVSSIILESEILNYFHTNNFINVKLMSDHPDYFGLVEKYKINNFPAYLYLDSKGNLLLPVFSSIDKDKMLVNSRFAMEKQNEVYPLAQMDLDYSNKNMNKNELFEYITKRTFLNLDNADIIDKYAVMANREELLNLSVLRLFLQQNNINVNGVFYNLIEKDKEKIMLKLNISKFTYHSLINKHIEYTFDKICENKNESELYNLISLKEKSLFGENPVILRNEYLTKYYYKTKQPLKLANYASVYANELLKHKEYIDRSPENIDSKKECATKLLEAAQYIAETLSNKTFLNNALIWTTKANEIFKSSNNYETKAYLLYKLGKRNEAIDYMEQAYYKASEDDKPVDGISKRLIKMKRGERIF